MSCLSTGYIKYDFLKKEASNMEDTHDYVEKLHEKQEQQEKHSKRKGNDHESQRLPNKKHRHNES